MISVLWTVKNVVHQERRQSKEEFERDHKRTRINQVDEKKKAGKKQLLSTKRPVISVVTLVRYFRYPRNLGSIFIMPSIGSNFFGKARDVCGNLLEKQFPLFLYTFFLFSKCLSLSLFMSFN